MIVRPEVVDLPTVADPEACRVKLQEMANDSLLGFVIRAAGEDRSAAVADYAEAFKDANYDLSFYRSEQLHYRSSRNVPVARGATFPIRRAKDVGLHQDFEPGIKSEPAALLGFHYQEINGVSASFFETTDEYDLLGNTRSFPVGTKWLFRHWGMVDDKVLRPIRYTATANETDAIIFRLHGKKPLVHDFRSLTYPRVSLIAQAEYQTPPTSPRA